MNIDRAKSELMQIYGFLSPDKQQAIDTYINDHRQLEADNTMLVLDYTATIRAIRTEIDNLRYANLINAVDNERVIDVALEIIDKHMGGNNDDNN